MNVDFIGSPNYTQGREGNTIDRIVVHWMDGALVDADRVFQDVAHQTSAHYGVEDGVIHKYVDEANTAYHAGDWAMNLRSIGIEHSAQPERDASDLTYQTSAKLIADICARYNVLLDREHIIKHSEVISTQCPGTIDIDKLINLAKGGTMQADEDFVKQAYWTGLHRNYDQGQVTDAELQGQIGRKPADILADFRTSNEWLTGNDYWINGATRLKQITDLQQQVKQFTTSSSVIQDIKPQEPVEPTEPVVEQVNKLTQNVIKPGYKTSEFWLTTAFNVAGYLSTVPQTNPVAVKVATYAAMAVTVVGYMLGRSNIKSN